MTSLPPKTTGHPVKKNAFVHKLYGMLSNLKLSHLIWWTDTPDANTFALYPSKEFADALSGYFKHGNVASFVRQLHMYGFHKVLDPLLHAQHDKDLPVWEFRHLLGKFKKDDESLLVYIKRRLQLNALRNLVVDAAARLALTPPPPQPPLQPQPLLQPALLLAPPYPYAVHYAVARNGRYHTYPLPSASHAYPDQPLPPTLHPQPYPLPQAYYPQGLVLHPPPQQQLPHNSPHVYSVPWVLGPVYAPPYYPQGLPPSASAQAAPSPPFALAAPPTAGPHTPQPPATLPAPSALPAPPSALPAAPSALPAPVASHPPGAPLPLGPDAKDDGPALKFRKPWDALASDRPRHPSLLYDPLAAPAHDSATSSPHQEHVTLPPLVRPLSLLAHVTLNPLHPHQLQRVHTPRLPAPSMPLALHAVLAPATPPVPPRALGMAVSKSAMEKIRPLLIELHSHGLQLSLSRSAPNSLSFKVRQYDLIGSHSLSVFSNNLSISSTSTGRSSSFGSISHLLVHLERPPSIGPHDKDGLPHLRPLPSVGTIEEEKSASLSFSLHELTTPLQKAKV